MIPNFQIVNLFRKRITIAIIFFLTFCLYSGFAVSHTRLVKSEPPNRATLTEVPEQVQLWFNENIEVKFASITLLDIDGNSVSENSLKIDPDNLKTVILSLPGSIAPGKYTVNYRVMSSDGHVVESDYSFTLKENTK